MASKLITRIVGLYTKIKHRNIPYDIRYYYRDTYYCQVTQWKYILKDYITKRPYKHIEFNGEFAPELLFVIPFAYWHYKNGTLKSTKSSKFTKELYFFSPDHQESFETREPEGNYNFEIPRILYSHDYAIDKFLPVPYKETFKNDVYVYDKPILIIANRYNMEWDGPPVSFLSITMLDFIIKNLKDDYTIVYNRPSPKNITMDNSDIYDLNEFDWLKSNYPEVILMEELYKENRSNARNFNHLQLQVYANASHFISTHGGTAALASCFGGINLILSAKGPEHHFKCFDILYPTIANTSIFHAKSDDELKKYIEQYLMKPLQ